MRGGDTRGGDRRRTRRVLGRGGARVSAEGGDARPSRPVRPGGRGLGAGMVKRGAPDADRVILIMGSGAQTAIETCKHFMKSGEKIGVLQVHLFRPFSLHHLLAVLPKTARKIAVLDRCKEPGAEGEPLYKDVITSLVEGLNQGLLATMPLVVGGRYGLSSKEFTPGMVKGIFDELKKDKPKNHFTIGIHDDVTETSLTYEEFDLEDPGLTQALFFALGADGTVGANKNSIKIIGENTDLHAQGYFVYDSKKS